MSIMEAFMIELTEEQCQAVRNGEPVRLAAADIGEDVVVLRADSFDKIREKLDDEQDQAAWAKLARNAANQWAPKNPY
jgi:hypothetical protein